MTKLHRGVQALDIVRGVWFRTNPRGAAARAHVRACVLADGPTRAHGVDVMSGDTTPEAPTATLADLDARWVVPIPSGRLRVLGGVPGERWASDGAGMFRISDYEYDHASTSNYNSEYDAYGTSWTVMGQHGLWGTMTATPVSSVHKLAQPDEFGPSESLASALRYGETWLSVQYIDIAMRLGATEIHLSGTLTVAVAPGVAAFMPIDPTKTAAETLADDPGES